MKIKMKKLLQFIFLVLAGAGFFACSDDEGAGPAPTAGFATEAPDGFKVDKTINFSSNSENAVSYVWSFGDGNTAIGKNVSHVYSAPGDYTVTLEATGNGQRDLASESITIEPIEAYIYFIDNDALKLRRISLADPSQVSDVFDLPGFSFGLAYDASNEQVYYSDDDAQKLFRNSIAGGSEVEIASELNSPRDIALDISNDMVYVVERSSDQITAIDLTDNSKSALYSVDDASFFLLPVGLDVYGDDIYATAVDFDAETVWKGGLDGSGISKIIDYNAGGFGYALEVDKVNERVYFDDNDTGSLLSANLDGSDVQVVGTSSDRCYGIAINNENGRVYWATRDGIIKSATLDGEDEMVLADLGVDIRGIILVTED